MLLPLLVIFTMRFEQVLIVVVAVIAFGVGFSYLNSQTNFENVVQTADLKSFESWDEVSSFLNTIPSYARGFDELEIMAVSQTTAVPQAAVAADGGEKDFSTTNIQVAGVDEADILKNDGTYLYTVSSGNLAISRVYPTSQAQLLSVINDSSFTELFVNGDKLVAFGNEEFNWDPLLEPFKIQEVNTATLPGVAMPVYRPDYMFSSASFVKVYDITDRLKPVLLKEIKTKGSYVTSRMIDGKVYVIFSDPVYSNMPRPLYLVDDVLREVAPSEVNYFDQPFESYSFTTMLGFDLSDLNKEETRKIVLMGDGQNIFVSKENAFITYTKNNYYEPLWKPYDEVVLPLLSVEYSERINAIEESNISQWRKDNLKIQVASEYVSSLNQTQSSELFQEIYEKENAMRSEMDTSEKTIIHKFALGSEILHVAKGEVPGHVLNQFSMDEYNGYFRVATTVGEVWRTENEVPAVNNVYVLDSALSISGSLEDLAPGEKIYSARFMGNRAYLVTFKKVDPLFVIDLTDTSNPQLLGKLKIPGYSDYLHPFDENHLIGIGKDAVSAEEGDFAWYQGVKLSLFDVSNVSNPIELASYKIGDRGTDSYALQDHRAFLFSRDRNLLVVPILLAEIDESSARVEPQAYGEYTFQGAYVFNVTLDGFDLRGRISHSDSETLAKSGEYYFGGGTEVQRSAYINDVLYTVSQGFIKANDLQSLSEQATVKLPHEEYPRLYGVDVIR